MNSTAIKIYPNPTKGNLQIDIISQDSKVFETPSNGFVVFDANGKKLIESSTVEPKNFINLSTYPNGVYLISLTISNKTKTYKVIKN